MTQTRSPSKQQHAANTSGSLLSPEQFARLRDRLAEYSGVYLDLARLRLLEHGLAQRLRATGDDLEAYERRIQGAGGRDELRLLAELVLNHETVFFRNGPHMRALREALLPELHRRKPAGAPIRIWSAGCATGEEPYSLAITALEALGQPLTRPVEIWATDLSEPALRKARTGFYRGRALQNLPGDILERYFKPKDDGYQVNDTLRALVRFESLNLLDPFPRYASSVDMIFCQNVTIYFQLKTCQNLIARFYECLPANGLLFLGFSETLWNIFDGFQSREVSGAYVYYKRSPEPTDVRASASLSRRNESQSAGQPQRALNTARAATPQNDKIGSHRNALPDQAATEQAHGQSDQAALISGRDLLSQGKLDDALAALRRISPDSVCAPQALTLTARIHADRGDLDLAAAEIQRAIEIDPLNEQAHLLLGVILARQGQWQSAIQQLERARYLSADSALVSFHLAEAYRQAGRTDKAAREYRNTLRKLDVHSPGALLDGVAVGWIRETCQRQIAFLPQPR
ncbi:MAG TPA: CheR family methyltransferase [Roseiflexaceae bacterium]|nr:CheR family methyltransferase [Roseiflexaceae bacterium]